MDAAPVSKSGTLLVVLAAALLLPGLPPAVWADPPPLGSACTIEGTAGADVLNGTSSADVICGLSGDDTINALGGEDLVIAGPGADTVDGGPGNDDLRGGPGDDDLSGGSGADGVHGDGDNDTANGGAGMDQVSGREGDDVLTGGLDADEVFGQGGADQVSGAAGDDKVDGGAGDDDVRGNTGADRVFGDDGNDHVYGSDHDDVLRGGSGNDDLYGQAGNDTMHDRDGAGNVDAAHCGTDTDVANIDAFDTADADCEDANVLDREDPVAVDDTKTVLEDSGPRRIEVLANDTDADGGPIRVASITQPANGTATIAASSKRVYYTPVADYCDTPPGTTPDTFTYTLAPGGSSATVSVKVACRPDTPVAADDTATVTEDAPATTIDVLANDAGPAAVVSSVTQPTNGTVVITNAGADLTYTPNPNYCNDPPGNADDTFTYTLTPDGDTATVSVTVTCVNDAPVADDEPISGADSAVGNSVLVHDDATDGAPTEAGPHKTISGDLLDGDTDLETPGTLTITAETVPSVDGGSAVIEADGDFVYTPKAGTSCTDTSDSFDYELNDGDGGTDTGTVTIAITGCVWYVRNNAAAGGDGTSVAPFDTLTEAESASGTSHTIFVFDGNNTSTGYDGDGLVLKSGQRLIGEHTGLQVGADVLHPANAGARPTLTATDADVVSLDDDNELRGLVIDPSGTGGGISGGTGDTNGTIAEVNITDGGAAGSQPGLELDATSGTFAVSDLTVSTSGATGVRLNSADTVTFAAVGTISVTTDGAKAVEAFSTDLGTSVLDSVTVTGSSSGGIFAAGTTGSLTFGDLALTTTSGATPAFSLSNAAGVTVPSSGTATVDATGGPAVDVLNSAGATLSFDSVSSSSSAGDGVNLDGLGVGTFSSPAGTISGAAGIAFDLNGGSGDLTYGGAITNGTGASVDVTTRSAGTVTFGGAISDNNDAGGGITLTGNTGGSTVFSAPTTLDTGASHAVSMTGSDGHTMRFTGGGLVLTTTSGRGFNADTSGTVTVQGTGNIINSTGGGRALSVANTDIGGDDVTFQSISANGGSQGIVLDTTGSAGNLAVTGSGGICGNGAEGGCSGGTIQNTTGSDDSSAAAPVGTGIVLNNTATPTFTRMWIKDHSNYGIRGTNVAGFTLANSVVNGNNGTSDVTDDSSLYFTGLTGSAAVTETFISGGFENNMAVLNTSGALDRLTITDSTFGASGSRPANDALLLESDPSAGALKTTITGTTFSSAAGDLFNFIHQGTAAGDVVLTGNTFTNSHPAIATGGGGVTMVTGATTTMAISNNTLRDAVGPGFLIAKLAGTATQSGTFSNNTLGASGVANSGSAEGSALKIQNVGGGTSTWAVTGNQIFGYNNFGIEVLAGGGSSAQSGAVNTTITNNVIAEPGNTAGTLTVPKQGVHLNIGTFPNDTFQVCADIRTNTLDASGADANPPQSFNFDVRLRQRQATTIRLPGYAGANNDDVAVQSFVNGINSAGTNSIATNTVPTGGGYVGGAACPTP